jgi:uncharacterized protein involved in type VI secretion and phage assembly
MGAFMSYFKPPQPFITLNRVYLPKNGETAVMEPQSFTGTEGLFEDFEFIIECLSPCLDSPHKIWLGRDATFNCLNQDLRINRIPRMRIFNISA